MYRSRSRPGRVTLAIMLIASAACGDDPAPTGPIEVPAPRFAAAKELLVTNTSGGTETGSLRWAASQVTGGEVIRFAPEIAGQTITLSAPVVLANYATIEGPADKGITISGGSYVRVFQLTHQQGEVVLRNLTITNGYTYPDIGGGIHSSGALRLEHSSVMGNSAPEAPAIFAFSATLINSTVSNNGGTENGASAVATYGQLVLSHSTVAYNSGGGVSSGPLILHNSIISNHPGEPNCVATSRTLQGINLSDDQSCGAAIVADPMLGAGSGGPTPVYGLTPWSPAINAGADCTLPVDQRYVARDAQCDIGAFEFTDFSKRIALTVDPNGSFTENGSAVLTGTLRCPSAVKLELEVELVQAQKQGRNTIEVSAVTSPLLLCDTSVRTWSVELVPAGGTFQRGSAMAGAVTANVEPAEPPASVAQAVKLSRAR